MAFWGPPGATFRVGLGNAPKWPSGDLLGPLSELTLEMLQNGLLGDLLGPLSELGLEMLQNGLLGTS